ncbi:phage-like element PBSX protein xkdE [Brevibacillus borstelensis AK1]|uniref:Phage-like element PBSX protein xkdE n=1 Tax=Brevibacillus borstelensis AK1 TaxID=1300222 RepID=M8E4P0_9BACL|nr:phage portal protein [Brevibacillus borstelensis]EMT54246.1 phage-like element PBSX protein xkdE [Brevibacillus borstelensis AK1]
MANEITVRIFKEANTVAGETKQIPDSFHGDYDGLVEPDYSPDQLKAVVSQSNILPQCIEAYATNAADFGLQIEYDERVDVNDEHQKKLADEDWARLEEFLYVMNPLTTPQEIIKHVVRELEQTGSAYLEVAWAETADTPTIYAADSEYIRAAKETTDKSVRLPYLTKTGEIKFIEMPVRTRKYVQKRSMNKVFFDQFLPMDQPGSSQILHIKLNDATSIYSEPRWIGNIPGILGTRMAEELNLKYFKKGKKIPVAVVAEGGTATKESVEQIKAASNPDNDGAWMLLEFIGTEVMMGDDMKVTKPTVRFEKLQDVLQQDGLFQGYDDKQREKALSQFRLPPIYVGLSQDYTRATADTARRITEEQVFVPYRHWLADKIFNKALLPAIGIHRVKVKLRGPEITDPEERTALLNYLADRGVLLVRDLIPIAESILGITIEESRYEAGYLDTPVAKLLESMSSNEILGTNIDPQEQVASIAKRLLRETRDKQHV